MADADNRMTSSRDAIVANPFLIGRQSLAARLDVSTPTLDRLNAAGKLPKPIRLGGRLLWAVEEIENWTRTGCPERVVWSVMWADLVKNSNKK